MSEVLLRNWKAWLVCLGLAAVVWYLVKERIEHGGRQGFGPLAPQSMSFGQ
ncbi:MAG: hypothetical protein ACR2OZ_12720 [Verrucomicrobiales bacterium]